MAKVLVSMTDQFLNKIDEIANDEQRSRSELIREALRSYIKRTKTVNLEVHEKKAKMLDDLLSE